MKLQFLLAGVLASLFAMTSIGVCHGGFGGGGFHGGGPRGFQGGNMSFQGGRFQQFHRPGFVRGRFFNGRFNNFNGHFFPNNRFFVNRRFFPNHRFFRSNAVFVGFGFPVGFGIHILIHTIRIIPTPTVHIRRISQMYPSRLRSASNTCSPQKSTARCSRASCSARETSELR